MHVTTKRAAIAGALLAAFFGAFWARSSTRF